MSKHTAELLTEILLTVFRLNGRILARGDELVKPLGLTSSRWQVLGAVALAGTSLTAPQIADAMGVTRQAVQKQLNLMLDDGFIMRCPNPRHERSPLYALTPQGDQIYQAAIGFNVHWTTELSEHFSTQELMHTLNTLEKCHRVLGKSLEN